jgi:glycosyltransferase involved in cell wall biosynthesis
MSATPTVSVVIPAHNAARWLHETIDSVLAQSFGDLELIVVNDASRDDTAAVARAVTDPRVRVIDNAENIGAPATRNRGIEAARGEFLAFLDADDLALPHRLERQVGFLRTTPEVGLCGAWAETFGARTEIWTAHPRHDQIKTELLFRSGLLQSTVVCRRALLQRFALRYDPAIALSEDYELWTRCAEVMRLANLTEVLVRYRIHGDNASIRGSERLRSFNRMIRARQLVQLGLAPTPEEVALHDALAEYGPTGPGACSFDLDAVERWLLRLRQANRQRGYVAESALRVALYEFWRRCCRRDERIFETARFLRSPVLSGTPVAWRLRDAFKPLLGLPHFPLPRT